MIIPLIVTEKFDRSIFKTHLTAFSEHYLIGNMSSKHLPLKDANLVLASALQIVGSIGNDSFMILTDSGGTSDIGYRISNARST